MGPRGEGLVIERLLIAQRALAEGELDQAERLFRQVADADGRNAIAVVGLAEVALARGDRDAAADLAARALVIDPEDAAAARIRSEIAAGPVVAARAVAEATAPEATPARQPEAAPGPMAEAPPGLPSSPSIIARLRAWLSRALRRRA